MRFSFDLSFFLVDLDHFNTLLTFKALELQLLNANFTFH